MPDIYLLVRLLLVVLSFPPPACSAGVYLKSDQMPHREEDAVDPKSRHKVGPHRRGLC
jgi:hypothetical protein